MVAQVLAARSEEGLQHIGSFLGEHAGSNFDLMIQTRVGKNFETGAHRAAFRVIGTVNETRNAGLHDRSRAHGARLDRDVQRCAG